MSGTEPNILLADAIGNELELPEGFGLTSLAPPRVSLALQSLVGRDGASLDVSASSIDTKTVEIKGTISNPTLIEEGSFQAARAWALQKYFEIMAFCTNALRVGEVRIYKEPDIELDPSAVGYDEELEPLGYYLKGYFESGSAPTKWGGFKNSVLDMTMIFVCPRPYWQGHFNETEQAGSAGGGTSISAEIVVRGSVPVSPQIAIYSASELSVPEGKEITLTISGLEVSWAGTIGAGKYLVFDTLSGQVYESSGFTSGEGFSWDGNPATNKQAGLTDTDDWAYTRWAFATGTYQVVVTSDMVGAANMTVYVLFANEYFG